ncbi:MAG: NTP transferase domain-containing protein, partial [Planctomycetes bacterium]|nr:NTP transferase domain-containing protein [Planctomycetota bacterium]
MSTTAIILAAGRGTRMKSAMPKVLHNVCGRPMLAHVMDACRQAGCDRLIVVVGFGAEQVRKAFAGAADVVWVEQTEQLGTGHAVMVCGEHLDGLDGPVLIVAGDGPLVRGETLAELLEAHARAGAACTLATCILDDPKAYGRILRDGAGELIGIVEYLDADEAQRAVGEVNVSLYCYDARRLREALGRLTNDNAKGEYY